MTARRFSEVFITFEGFKGKIELNNKTYFFKLSPGHFCNPLSMCYYIEFPPILSHIKQMKTCTKKRNARSKLLFWLLNLLLF